MIEDIKTEILSSFPLNELKSFSLIEPDKIEDIDSNLDMLKKLFEIYGCISDSFGNIVEVIKNVKNSNSFVTRKVKSLTDFWLYYLNNYID